MLTGVLHWLVKHPLVYDAVMVAVGARRVGRTLMQELAKLELRGDLVDVGGGTGLMRAVLPPAVTHICLDLDPLKLAGYRSKYPRGLALLGDATALPLADASVDTVVCGFMAHHLDDEAVRRMVDEGHRVLKPGGHFVLADPLFVARRWPARLLWRYDRGRHPRTLDAHREFVRHRFPIISARRFAAVHAYGLIVGRKS